MWLSADITVVDTFSSSRLDQSGPWVMAAQIVADARAIRHRRPADDVIRQPALFTNGDGATGRVAQGAVPAGLRAVGPPRPVRRAPRGVRASG